MTAILATVNPLGCGIGFIVPVLLVPDDESLTIEEGKDKTKNLMVCQATICGVVLLLTLIFFRNKPKIAPNAAENSKKINFKKGIVILFKNKQFWLMLIAFSLISGSLSTYASIVDLVLNPFNFSSSSSAVCGALIIVSGITSSIIFGMLANKTHKYKLIFRICAGISTVALGLLIGSMYTEKPFLLYASAFLYGFGAMSLMPITSEYGCEQFFPLGEALITGCFVCSGSIVGSALIFLYTEVIENDKKSSTLFMHLVFIGCGFVSLLLTCFFTEDLKRTQFNKESEFKKIPLETNEDQIEANVELQQVQ
eukprot:TRINITY_DN8880_c0_g1_i1.p2 TRINITY_DN8880_c0_g1~~TRINITY_DN8880_c0_g1_i1.p2  ORF type:complete len:310 (-),score=32.67 TRINITY_DN8880_c0_g1_i1:115-1044(-)